MRAESATVTGARIEPTAAAVHEEEVPGTDGTRAMGRRMQRGTVKWFSDAKGYGFIQADDGTDIFVHRSGIVGDGFRTLHEGQAVEYEQAQSGKGLLAVDVVPAGPGTVAARR
jgi:CspA family cold shock protein